MSTEPTLAERKVIYRARRGLKELDVFFDPYVKQRYLYASAEEKALFAELVAAEDPDLLDWFMAVSLPPTTALSALIEQMKQDVHQA
jgi:antitoxin CptB